MDGNGKMPLSKEPVVITYERFPFEKK